MDADPFDDVIFELVDKGYIEFIVMDNGLGLRLTDQGRRVMEALDAEARGTQ